MQEQTHKKPRCIDRFFTVKRQLFEWQCFCLSPIKQILNRNEPSSVIQSLGEFACFRRVWKHLLIVSSPDRYRCRQCYRYFTLCISIAIIGGRFRATSAALFLHLFHEHLIYPLNAAKVLFRSVLSIGVQYDKPLQVLTVEDIYRARKRKWFV